MTTYIEIQSEGNGFKIYYNIFGQAVKFKEAFVKKIDILNIALSYEETWVEVETTNKTYQFSCPPFERIPVIEIVNGVAISSNRQLYDILKDLIKTD